MVPVMKRACSRHVVAAARCACRWFSRLAIICFTEGIYGIARAHHVKVYDVLRVRLVGGCACRVGEATPCPDKP